MAKMYLVNDGAKGERLIGKVSTLSSEETSEVAGESFVAYGEGVEDFLRLITAWEGCGVVIADHRPTASWIFIALHETRSDKYVGGCRIKIYPKPAEALRDAMLLAEAMTHKWAIIGSELGGGKAVLALTKALSHAERTELLLYFARLLEELDGLFWTGGDLGATPLDITTLAQASQYVHGFDHASGRILDSGYYTAMGVTACLRVALRRVFGSEHPAGRTILVQGVGQVGGHLARMLAESGATVLISDIKQEQAELLAGQLGCEVIQHAEVYTTDCDVYAPCAVGGTLNEQSTALLKCRIVAGAANNQLQDITVADRLHRRRILYAPDYVINAGGAIALPMLSQGAQESEVCRRVVGIADTLAQILDEAASRDESPLHTAERRVRQLCHTSSPDSRLNAGCDLDAQLKGKL